MRLGGRNEVESSSAIIFFKEDIEFLLTGPIVGNLTYAEFLHLIVVGSFIGTSKHNAMGLIHKRINELIIINESPNTCGLSEAQNVELFCARRALDASDTQKFPLYFRNLLLASITSKHKLPSQLGKERRTNTILERISSTSSKELLQQRINELTERAPYGLSSPEIYELLGARTCIICGGNTCIGCT